MKESEVRKRQKKLLKMIDILVNKRAEQNPSPIIYNNEVKRKRNV